MHWLFLALTIVGGVFGSSMLKINSGFSKLLPSVGVVIGFLAVPFIFCLLR